MFNQKQLFKLLAIITLPLMLALPFAQANAANEVLLLELNEAIGPASADYLSNGIKHAHQQNAKLLILQIDTPGGLDRAMRSIIKDIINSKVPIVTYVAPGGARAASAGTYILYASHVAAMAPGTNLGAATPVNILGDNSSKEDFAKDDKANNSKQKTTSDIDSMKRKSLNDAVAYIRSLAELRNRNVEWGEAAVRHAASLSAEQALQQNIIDLVADSIPELLQKLNGSTIKIADKPIKLNTSNAVIKNFQPNWHSKLLSVITDPSVAYILFLIAIYGIFFEFANPGFVLPGVVGSICLLLALYAFQLLPINYTGLILILLGICFMVAEAFMASFGALGLGGIVAFIAGSVLLFDPINDVQVAWSIIAAISIANVGFFTFIVGMAVKAKRRDVVSGSELILKDIAKATSSFTDSGKVLLQGEIWQATSKAPIEKGQKVRVIKINGLILDVEPYEDKV